MLVGHFAVGLLAKRAAPRASLGTLMFAAMLPDLLFFVFLMAGIEQAQVARGGLIAQNITLSHSLLTGAIWGALLAAAYFFWRRYRPGAWAIFAGVLSHWLLDFVSHKPDMPLAPGVRQYFGLGLWNSVPATLVVEGGLWVVAVILYARAARPKNRVGIFAFWSMVVLLTLAWINNIAGPPPNPSGFELQGLIFFSAAVAWFYWVNRRWGML
jgi:membrane-bound metal-dependent hydrolase YbcI (DUF457 family)